MSCSAVAKRNPVFAEDKAPAPTLLTGVVSCLAPIEVAAAGRRVRRAQQLGAGAVRRLEERLARIGPKAPQLGTPTCEELTDEGATDLEDWYRPPPPLDFTDLLELASARSLLISVVSSEIRCTADERAWIWGEPTYEDQAGEVDCHEHRLVLSSFLYGADGTLLWKGTVDETLERLIDPAALADELLEGVPVETAASLHGRAPAAAPEDALSAPAAPPEDASSPSP